MAGARCESDGGRNECAVRAACEVEAARTDQLLECAGLVHEQGRGAVGVVHPQPEGTGHRGRVEEGEVLACPERDARTAPGATGQREA